MDFMQTKCAACNQDVLFDPASSIQFEPSSVRRHKCPDHDVRFLRKSDESGIDEIAARTEKSDFQSALEVVCNAAGNEAANCHATGRELGEPDGTESLREAIHIRSAIGLVLAVLGVKS